MYFYINLKKKGGNRYFVERVKPPKKFLIILVRVLSPFIDLPLRIKTNGVKLQIIRNYIRLKVFFFFCEIFSGFNFPLSAHRFPSVMRSRWFSD